LVVVKHETSVSVLPFEVSGFGLDWMLQALPFHLSTWV
jgi:hypothetical protein